MHRMTQIKFKFLISSCFQVTLEGMLVFDADDCQLASVVMLEGMDDALLINLARLLVLNVSLIFVQLLNCIKVLCTFWNSIN